LHFLEARRDIAQDRRHAHNLAIGVAQREDCELDGLS
jgi:hypothetical protein